MKGETAYQGTTAQTLKSPANVVQKEKVPDGFLPPKPRTEEYKSSQCRQQAAAGFPPRQKQICWAGGTLAKANAVWRIAKMMILQQWCNLELTAKHKPTVNTEWTQTSNSNNGLSQNPRIGRLMRFGVSGETHPLTDNLHVVLCTLWSDLIWISNTSSGRERCSNCFLSDSAARAGAGNSLLFLFYFWTLAKSQWKKH